MAHLILFEDYSWQFLFYVGTDDWCLGKQLMDAMHACSLAGPYAFDDIAASFP